MTIQLLITQAQFLAGGMCGQVLSEPFLPAIEKVLSCPSRCIYQMAGTDDLKKLRKMMWLSPLVSIPLVGLAERFTINRISNLFMQGIAAGVYGVALDMLISHKQKEIISYGKVLSTYIHLPEALAQLSKADQDVVKQISELTTTVVHKIILIASFFFSGLQILNTSAISMTIIDETVMVVSARLFAAYFERVKELLLPNLAYS